MFLRLAAPVAVIILYIPCVLVTMIIILSFKEIRRHVTRGRVKDDVETGKKNEIALAKKIVGCV